MIVLDTNILIRVITKDHIAQTEQAIALLKGPGPFWIGVVVLLETAWTLKSSYKYQRAQIYEALRLITT